MESVIYHQGRFHRTQTKVDCENDHPNDRLRRKRVRSKTLFRLVIPLD